MSTLDGLALGIVLTLAVIALLAMPIRIRWDWLEKLRRWGDKK